MFNNSVLVAAREYAKQLRNSADQIEKEIIEMQRRDEGRGIDPITIEIKGRKPATIKTTAPAKRTISAEGRKRISIAQRKRWAARKSGSKA